jgi:hypothetical protein
LRGKDGTEFKKMKKNYRFILFFLSCASPACTVDTDALTGHWQAVAFYENGQQQPVVVQAIELQFMAGKRYAYRSIGHYMEAGKYRSVWQYLLLTDTTAKSPVERIVKILHQSQDTLKLEMQSGVKSQVLFLKRI